MAHGISDCPGYSIRVLSLSFFLFLLSSVFPLSASAASDMEIRDRWAKTIGEIKRNECLKEKDGVRDGLAMAAALIFHGELEDAREALKEASRNAESEACRDAVAKSESP